MISHQAHLAAASSHGCAHAPWGAAARLGRALAVALAIVAAALPMLAFAQAVTGHNVKYVSAGGLFTWAESGQPGRWGAQADFIEVERNETTVRLKHANGSTAVLDIAKKAIWMTGPFTVNGMPMRTISAVSGLSVNYVHLQLHEMIFQAGQPPKPEFRGNLVLAEQLDNGTSLGWKTSLVNWALNMSRPSVAATVPLSAVSRTAETITFAEPSGRIEVNVVTGQCTYQGYACTVASTSSVTGENVGQIHHREENPHGKEYPPLLAKLVKTNYAGDWAIEDAKGQITTWRETARGVDFIELSLPNGARMRYNRNGTHQRMFAGTNTWVAAPDVTSTFVAPVWKGQLGTRFEAVSPGISPGFQIQNKTDFPVLVTLEQLGCLYYEIVQPGKVFQRNTGAVWFTIKASMAPDLKEPTVESCIRRPAMYAATIVVAGLSAAGTMGMGTALVVPAMLMAAAGQGAAIATHEGILTSGGTLGAATAGQVRVSMLTQAGSKVGLVFLAGQGNLFTTGALFNAALLGLPAGAAAEDFTDLFLDQTTQADINDMQAGLIQEARVDGAYAGYPWPWKMVDRVMPRYDITGGPIIKTLRDGSTVILKQKSPLTIRRVN